jgi:hypothetical protein
MWTDWFIAGPDEAEVIASIVTTEEHDWDDWPHLQLKGILDMELMSLWGILRGEPAGSTESISGELLFSDPEQMEGSEEGLIVSEVAPAFIAALARVPKDEIRRHAAAWAQTESLSDWAKRDLERVIREVSDFARRARAARKPVLDLAVW